ncbi:MAG: DUF1648 domain-containing protein [Saprospiraceae bacterium]|nr:DUF1648 domain-containing protein [Saprospiraceae bacterium]MBK7736453.1 DUF1648 domain-containing protein [Saprospiraceae bacterium]
MWVFLLANFSDLPEVIPQHYNAYGKADGFGSKSNLFILAGIASLLNIGLSILKKYPHRFNYPVEITKENEFRQYAIATRMLRFVKLILVLIFSSLIIKTILIAKGGTHELGFWFLPIALVCLIGSIAYFLILSFRSK